MCPCPSLACFEERGFAATALRLKMMEVVKSLLAYVGCGFIFLAHSQNALSHSRCPLSDKVKESPLLRRQNSFFFITIQSWQSSGGNNFPFFVILSSWHKPIKYSCTTPFSRLLPAILEYRVGQQNVCFYVLGLSRRRPTAAAARS